jgi:hypothetical protein
MGVTTIDHSGNDNYNSMIVYTEFLDYERHFSSCFHNHNGALFYHEYLNDTLYQISKDKSEPWQYIDFLDLKITPTGHKELLAGHKAKGRFPSLSKSQAGDVNVYHETDEMIKLNCTYKEVYSSIWINKSNNQQLMIHKKSVDGDPDPLTELIGRSTTTNESGNFVSNISTDIYLALFQNSIFKGLIEKGIIEIEGGGFKNQNNVTLDSNPVIAVIEFGR